MLSHMAQAYGQVLHAWTPLGLGTCRSGSCARRHRHTILLAAANTCLMLWASCARHLASYAEQSGIRHDQVLHRFTLQGEEACSLEAVHTCAQASSWLML